MAYEGYLTFGGNEIINNERARALSQGAACPMWWLKGPQCTTLMGAMEDSDYGDIYESPWFDPTIPDVSSRFFGVFGMSIRGIEDSSREVQSTQGISDGGVVGRTRRAMRTIRIKALLLGQGRDALEYGMAWLDAALDPDACGSRSTECGTAELAFLADCPPNIGTVTDGEDTRPQNGDEYRASVNEVRRFIRGAAAVSGPFITSEMTAGKNWGYVVEIVLTSEKPGVLGITKPVTLPPAVPIIIQDIPYNLVTHPSAELPGSTLVVATNYSTNPSVEANATGWNTEFTMTSGVTPAGAITGTRTDELAASGGYSYRTRLFPTSGTAASRAWVGSYQDVTIPVGATVSFNIWGAAVLISGQDPQTKIYTLAANGEWFDAAGNVLGNFVIGSWATSSFGGRVFSRRAVKPPANAVRVRVRLRADVSWIGSTTPSVNSDIRVYADALAVTIP